MRDDRRTCGSPADWQEFPKALWRIRFFICQRIQCAIRPLSEFPNPLALINKQTLFTYYPVVIQDESREMLTL